MKILRDTIKRDTYMCQKVLNMVKRGELRKDHPQQRKAMQWDNSTRDAFIATVIKNEDFDSLKICEQLTDNGVVLWLIDGLQRLSTLDSYKNNVFSIGRSISYPVIEYQVAKLDVNGKIMKDEDGNQIYEIRECDLRGKRYNDLPEELKENFDNCPIDIVKHLDCDNERIAYNIIRYNSSVNMNVSQKAITYMSNVAKYVKDLSSHDFFADNANFTDTEKRKGGIDKAVTEAVMAINCWDNWNKNAKKIGTHLNQHATKEMFLQFEGYLNRLALIVKGDAYKLFTSKNSVLWFMLFNRFNKLNIDDVMFGEFLSKFVEELHSKEVNGISFDVIDKERSTKDKGILENKMSILESLMNEFLHINIEETTSEGAEKLEKNVEILDQETENFINEFSNTNLLCETSLSDADKKAISLDVLEFVNDKDDALFYADCANEWVMNMEEYEKVVKTNILPAIVGLVKYIYELEQTDEQGMNALNKFLSSNAISNDVRTNYIGMVSFA